MPSEYFSLYPVVDLDRELREYARLTARDIGASYNEAVRAMRDEPEEVAREVGCSVRQVLDWCEREVA